MEQARDKEQQQEASPTYERDMVGLPAHMQAAAEAAGEMSALSGPQDIATASETTAAQAIHGTEDNLLLRLASNSHGSAGSWAAPNSGIPHSAFDSHDPPSPELIDDCVHCGFCLPTCPTYVLWGEEMDSPRGRIHLMKVGNEGKVAMTDTYVRHFDQCLGCMACITACPSGVQYNKLIESTRQQIERRYPRTRSDRLFRAMLFALFPHPARLRLLALPMLFYQRSGMQSLVTRTGLLSRLPTRLASLHNLMPPVTLKGLRRRIPAYMPARGQRRARVGLLTGCVQRVFFSQVNAATVRVLAAEGCEVYAPPTQECCGALALHAGREEDAQRYARELIRTFEQYKLDYIAVNAAGCGSSMKEYGYLLRDDPQFAERATQFSQRVRDITELLDELGPVAPRKPLKARVAYHDACHLAHAQGVRRQPRRLLESIPGVELVPIPEADICCGSAGIYNLVEPEPASELGERKTRHILSTGAQVVASANPGCTLQIESTARRLGYTLKVLHPIEILDMSVRGARD
ncbi:MAG TPA: (Fe-S)-binding protein [Chloroflexia bacterium]|nr:(Fe-S)-binding protein [Chloroflexia bacterium]